MCVCVNLCSTRFHIIVRVHSNARNITENIIILHMQLDCNLVWQSHIDYLINKPDFDVQYVDKIYTHCKSNNVG
jgi:hypothetical protein